jgi:hypothetical protein
MPPQATQVRRTFRLTIDVETTLDPAAPDGAPSLRAGARYQQALIRGLEAHPEVLRQFLRSLAVDAVRSAGQQLEAEYGWGRASEHQLLEPIITELEPAAQAYFTEEVEDGASVYYVDCHHATVRRFAMIELDDEKNGR